jgi:arsenate reductase
MKTVVFACVHNAGRSQMAAAWFNHLRQLPTANSQLPMDVHAISAGTSPADRVHPEVVEVMREVGIDLSSAKPQKLTLELAQGADLLVTMGCGDQCPYVPGLKVEDWPLEDPKGQPIERVREIRDEIQRRVAELLNEPTAFVHKEH